jgi:hypothetical protein
MSTTIFIDWDDTLFPSTHLANLGSPDPDKKIREELESLSQSVINLINCLRDKGTIYIITNSDNGWVKICAAKYMPSLVPFLETIEVISAKSIFEDEFPDSPVRWKFNAMEAVLKRDPNELSAGEHHVISFGDSFVEREALLGVVGSLAFKAHAKNIKIAERSTTEQLIRQLNLICQCDCFNYIFNHQGSLDLQLVVTIPNLEPTGPNLELPIEI